MGIFEKETPKFLPIPDQCYNCCALTDLQPCEPQHNLPLITGASLVAALLLAVGLVLSHRNTHTHTPRLCAYYFIIASKGWAGPALLLLENPGRRLSEPDINLIKESSDVDPYLDLDPFS